VPALLALAEERGASGRELLDAYIVGLEVLMRIGDAVNMQHYHQGWHATATLGAVAAAAACARLRGLDAGKTAAALGLATSMAGGFKSQFGTSTKPLHAGFAAKAGVLASALAAAGASAARDALDGDWSILNLMAGPEAPGFEEPLKRLGSPLGIEAHGLHVKLYPCCGYIHKGVDGIIELRERHALEAADIAAVNVRIPAHNADILMYPEPQTPKEARFSLEYCAAVAAVTGGLGIADFTPAAIRRPEVTRFLPRVTLDRHPTGPRSSDLDFREPEVATLRLADGRVLERAVDHARGSPELPISETDLAEKFRACAAGVLDPGAVASALELITRLEASPYLSELTRHLAARRETTA
jgi:2-methylcitrate dehydratase PrpD